MRSVQAFVSSNLVWVLMVALLSNAAAVSAEEPSGALSGLVIDQVKGGSVKFSDFVGKKPIVISFWATFCKPCKAEMPFLQKLHETYGAQGLVVVGISLDTPETEAGVRTFLDKNRFTYTQCIDRQSQALDVLNPKSVLPYLVLVDKSGKIVMTKDGFTVGDQPALEQKVKALLTP